MKNVIFFVLCVPFLASCYAFLQADKLVYAGTLAKPPVEVVVDTAYTIQLESR